MEVLLKIWNVIKELVELYAYTLGLIRNLFYAIIGKTTMTGSEITHDVLFIILVTVPTIAVIALLWKIYDEISYRIYTHKSRKREKRNKQIEKNAFKFSNRALIEDIEDRKALDRALGSQLTGEELGALGEKECALALKKIKGMTIFKNVFPYKYDTDGALRVGECDVIGVTDKTIYVFEVKSYSGYISPSNETYWLNTPYALGVDSSFKKSPALQNKGHVNMILDAMDGIVEKKDIVPIVVFHDRTTILYGGDCERKDSLHVIKDNYICNNNELKKTVEEIENSRTNSINTAAVKEMMKKFVNAPQEVRNVSLRNAMMNAGR